MEKMSAYFFTAGFITVGLATVLYLWYAATRQGDAGRFATIFAWMAAALLTGSVITRTIVAQRGPFANMYEFSLSFGWGILVAYVVMERQYKLRTMGAFVVPVSLLLLLYALTVPSAVQPLVPALQNNLLLTIHVSLAIVAYAMVAVAFGSAVMYLIQESRQNRVSILPPADFLDAMGYRAVLIAFPFIFLMIVIGALWADIAWGRYWGWDPKETASLVTWLIYAGYLHSRAVAGWRGKPTATLLIVGFVATMFTYFGVNLFLSGLHNYAGTS
ncbi:MAG TPA: c-type cytochrome biogenesis protein CcsB [Dehalococcoidia bacterium]|nr:c-type cytochrome biogenesis protein CcsB [Dehalococcoidia bacterium]